MRVFRSKSNLIFGIIILIVVVISEISMIIGLVSAEKVSTFTVVFMLLVFAIALYHFIDGMQTIKLDETGVTHEIVFLPVKAIKWDDIIEAGIGKIKVNKTKYSKQLYVSAKRLDETKLEDLDSFRFDTKVIWFDYSEASQERLASGLGMK